MAKNEDDAIRTINLDVLKSIASKNDINKASKTSILRAWKEGRISGLNAIRKLGGWKKGGAVKKYSHGGSVHNGTGHALTYKR